AVYYSSMPILDILIENGIKIDPFERSNTNGYTLLETASHSGSNNSVYRLLSGMSFSLVKELELYYQHHDYMSKLIKRCAKEMLNIQKNIFIIARIFFRHKNKVPIAILISILSEPILYPAWYKHRIKKDVELIFKKIDPHQSQPSLPASLTPPVIPVVFSFNLKPSQ